MKCDIAASFVRLYNIQMKGKRSKVLRAIYKESGHLQMWEPVLVQDRGQGA